MTLSSHSLSFSQLNLLHRVVVGKRGGRRSIAWVRHLKIFIEIIKAGNKFTSPSALWLLSVLVTGSL